MSVWRRFIVWIWSCFSVRGRTWKSVRVDDLPDRLQKHRIYLIGEDGQVWQAAMLCPCGCAALIQLSVLPKSRPNWAVTPHADGTVSLHPSVWRTTGCRSHFFLRRGQIEWC
jgi:hypothetical protein